MTWLEPTDDGGAPILSYIVEIDDGQGGDFVALVGVETNYLALSYTKDQGIIRSTNYRFRHRYRNQIGYGEYSEIAYILSATIPGKPPRPVMVSTGIDSITLSLQ